MTFDMNYIEWGVIDDPDMALDAIYLSSATLNFMGYKNDEMDAILLEVKTISDPEVRKEKMMEFQELFVEELPRSISWCANRAMASLRKSGKAGTRSLVCTVWRIAATL